MPPRAVNYCQKCYTFSMEALFLKLLESFHGDMLTLVVCLILGGILIFKLGGLTTNFTDLKNHVQRIDTDLGIMKGDIVNIKSDTAAMKATLTLLCDHIFKGRGII